MALIKKLASVILTLLTISSIACTRVIPVKLELPKKPNYYHNINEGVTAIYDRDNAVLHFKVTVKAMKKLVKNKVLCREDSKTLRAIIKTTH